MTCILFYRNFLWSLTTLDDSLRLSYTFLLMIKICTAYFTHIYKCFDSSLSKYCWPFNIVVISLILKRWWFDIYEMLLMIFSFTFTSTLPELQDYVCIIASLLLRYKLQNKSRDLRKDVQAGWAYLWRTTGMQRSTFNVNNLRIYKSTYSS